MIDPDRSTPVNIRLKRAIEARALPRELLISGPAGTGKTYGILCILHMLAADFRGLRILFCRQTRASLTESVMVTFEQEVLPRDSPKKRPMLGRASRKVRTNYPYRNGSEIVLAGLDEPSRVNSTAWDFAYINEAIETREDGWETVGNRLNRPGRDRRFGYLIGDTNPGDPSHWLKRRCDEGRTALWDTGHHANPALWDGRDWTPDGRLYMGRLSRLTGTRRRRYLEGLWAAGEGQWFETFGGQHVTPAAEFDPRLPVHLAVDSGVHTGAVWFQVREGPDGYRINVFGDYYAFNMSAFDNAGAILARFAALCSRSIVPRHDRLATDPAGKANNPVGPTVLGEYERAGLKLDYWPKYPGSVGDGLSLIESFVAVNPPALTVHPRCTRLIEAFANYKRMKRAGQWIDRPEDNQNPHEDLMDALRGGLQDRFPEGRKPTPRFARIQPRHLI